MEKTLKNVLTKYGFTFKKAFGQNFLTDENLLAEIVEKAGVTENDTVLEIGCGAGALTRQLAKKAKRVIGYEIDLKLKPILGEMLEDFDNVEIIFKDVMREKLADLEEKLGENYILVANLPYYITSPIIMNFIEKANKIKAMVVMVQEEVAFRLTAKAGTSDYGAITVAVDLRGYSEIIKKVGREMFTPPPNVDSAVVKITINKNKYQGVDFNGVRDVVRIAFMSRRKMFANNLMQHLKLTRATAENALIESGLSPTCRGETLNANQFIALTQNLKKTKVNTNET